jgi:putative sterol carrier protein
MAETDPTISELMNRMPRAFKPEAAEGVNTVLQYHLTGEEGGDWVVTIQDGVCAVREGVTDNPRMTLTSDAQDYKNVILGRTNAMQAFMTGKLKMAGDLALAMKLPAMFKMG